MEIFCGLMNVAITQHKNTNDVFKHYNGLVNVNRVLQ
jgi:hypothetical protein